MKTYLLHSEAADSVRLSCVVRELAQGFVLFDRVSLALHLAASSDHLIYREQISVKRPISSMQRRG